MRRDGPKPIRKPKNPILQQWKEASKLLKTVNMITKSSLKIVNVNSFDTLKIHSWRLLAYVTWGENTGYSCSSYDFSHMPKVLGLEDQIHVTFLMVGNIVFRRTKSQSWIVAAALAEIVSQCSNGLFTYHNYVNQCSYDKTAA